MKTAIARRTFRRPDNLRLIACGQKFTAPDEVIDQLAQRRVVHSVVAIVTKAPQVTKKRNKKT